MDNNSTTNCVTSLHCNSNTRNHLDFRAKLRRLKIEESILAENLNKNTLVCSRVDSESNPVNNIRSAEFKKFAIAIKKSYNDLQQLFQDIKACTSSKDHIISVDIDDLKKNTFDLENNMKSFKLYLHKELSNLKTVEKELNVKKDPTSKSYLKPRLSTQAMKYIELVTSPVKVTMNSPFKCSEVQAFQEFMSLSKNRYGGWTEYHHNIFINIWQKYLDTEYSMISNEAITDILHSTEFKLLADELLPKLQGVDIEEIISHTKWYINYLYLKKRQQEAIDKWRTSRRFMKSNVGNNLEILSSKNIPIRKKKCTIKTHIIKADYLNSSDKEDKSGCYVRKCLSDVIKQNSNNSNSLLGNNFENDQAPNFLKSTKQWSIKRSSVDLLRSSVEYKSVNEVFNIENIRKLGVPLWRARL